MEENFEPQNYNMPKEKKNSGFKKGVLVGVLSTLAIVIVLTLGVVMAVSTARIARGLIGNGLAGNKIGSETTGGEDLISTDLLSQMSMIYSYLEDYYLYDMDNEKIRTGILEGMIDALDDPYSEYYNADELSSFQDSTEGEYVGIGAAVTQELSTGIVRISRPYEGTPSAKAGLLPGDIVISVDDIEVTGMDLNQVVSAIKGEEGTSVTLHIYREEEEAYYDIVVQREQVEIPTVISEMLEDNIGYIEVTGFEGVTANQFIEAYKTLKSQGMERIIVDLRDNGGGLVDTVEEMLDYLLPEGIIFYAKDKNGRKSMEYNSDAGAALDIPMVVLVNGNTASASEIFSGNIQEFGMGKIVGTTTYGKGVMQQMFYTNLKQTAAIKLTVADYYIHSDRNINGVGITPDVEIELDESVANMVEIPKEQDNQLQKAIEVVKGE